jgi:hypothetical protein
VQLEDGEAEVGRNRCRTQIAVATSSWNTRRSTPHKPIGTLRLISHWHANLAALSCFTSADGTQHLVWCRCAPSAGRPDYAPLVSHQGHEWAGCTGPARATTARSVAAGRTLSRATSSSARLVTRPSWHAQCLTVENRPAYPVRAQGRGRHPAPEPQQCQLISGGQGV